MENTYSIKTILIFIVASFLAGYLLSGIDNELIEVIVGIFWVVFFLYGIKSGINDEDKKKPKGVRKR